MRKAAAAELGRCASPERGGSCYHSLRKRKGVLIGNSGLVETMPDLGFINIQTAPLFQEPKCGPSGYQALLLFMFYVLSSEF